MDTIIEVIFWMAKKYFKFEGPSKEQISRLEIIKVQYRRLCLSDIIGRIIRLKICKSSNLLEWNFVRHLNRAPLKPTMLNTLKHRLKLLLIFLAKFLNKLKNRNHKRAKNNGTYVDNINERRFFSTFWDLRTHNIFEAMSQFSQLRKEISFQCARIFFRSLLLHSSGYIIFYCAGILFSG